MTGHLQLLTSQNALCFLNTFTGSHLEPAMKMPLLGGDVYDVSQPHDTARAVSLHDTGAQLMAESQRLCAPNGAIAIVPHTQNEWVTHINKDATVDFHYTGRSQRLWNHIELHHDDIEMTIALSKRGRGREGGMTYYSNIEMEWGYFSYDIIAQGNQLNSLKHYFGLTEVTPTELLRHQVLAGLGVELDSILAAQKRKASKHNPAFPGLTTLYQNQLYLADETRIEVIHDLSKRGREERLTVWLRNNDESLYPLPEVVRPLWNWATADESIVDTL